MRPGHMARVLGGMAAVMLFLTGMIAVAFFLTAVVYAHTGVQPPTLLAQIINSFLGLFLSFLILSIVGRVFSPRLGAQRMGWSGPIIQALERIAQGDFSVRLGDDLPNNGLVGELAKSVNSMAVELDTMEKMRQEFISNVSHEIQSPLTSIRGFALALRSNHLSPEERNHYLKIIEAESQRLSRITDNLLKLASLESKEIKFEAKPYRLDKQIRNLILACEPQWTGKGIDLDVALDEINIIADEDLLSQVWINLIHNSIKFTPDGGKVSVALQRRDGKIEFRIADTGIGIAEEDQARVFERFYKADQSRRRSTEGSGLGLAIAQKIVEMHQGTIDVESKVGKGTMFMVSLPDRK
jgi:two-component system, OmpR family, phosphate regulon sensor histidine kinase PhoR